jgi:hypothetical protein
MKYHSMYDVMMMCFSARIKLEPGTGTNSKSPLKQNNIMPLPRQCDVGIGRYLEVE